VPLRLLAVLVGGVLGGGARWAVSSGTSDVPWVLVAVNAAGALVLAASLVVLLERAAAPWLRAFVGTGFCGALTTFSGIVVPGDELVRDGRPGVAAAYVSGSLVAGLVAGYAGLVLGRALVRRTP
jgi:fluoride exporter